MSGHETLEMPEGEMLKVRFQGFFTLAQCNALVRGLSQFLESDKSQRVVLLWDCSGLSGLDRVARKVWMDFLKEYKENIAKVVVVSDSLFVRGAARLVLKLLGFDLEILRTQQELNKVSWPRYSFG